MGGILSTNLQGKLVIDASSGLSSRTPGSQETMGTHAEQGDPHFWLDPTLVIKYTENIRDGLIQMDPEGEAIYRQNAINYIDQLKRLDEWIMQQVSVIPPERRQIITNHESFGYYADRYGFTIIGTIIPSVTTGASSSPQQLSQLIDRIKSSNVKAIFLETGANSQLADQISKETGVTIIDSLFTHSITGPDGNAPSYLDMMQWDTQQIVKVLK
jgi:ABC-type Zn uptake system ZnuABC Zn-binding protein ZnuA